MAPNKLGLDPNDFGVDKREGSDNCVMNLQIIFKLWKI